MVLPSPLATPEAQQHILSETSCIIYMHSGNLSTKVDGIVTAGSEIQIIVAPELIELLQDKPAEPVSYSKSWEDSKDDPWLVFHISGTTGQS